MAHDSRPLSALIPPLPSGRLKAVQSRTRRPLSFRWSASQSVSTRNSGYLKAMILPPVISFVLPLANSERRSAAILWRTKRPVKRNHFAEV